VSVSPVDWTSIDDLERSRTNLKDNIQLPLSRFKTAVGKVMDAVKGYVNLKTFHFAVGWFLFLGVVQAATLVWYLPATFGRNRERLDLAC
jgi:hypothetical protein